MKKILATLLLFMSIIGYSQTNGITYQAVIMNPAGEQLPGVNNTNAPLANKNICLKFSIIDNNSQSEYIETVQTTTDEYGMVNLVIGTGVQIGGYASSFSNILWNANPKSLKVDLSTTGVCSYYTEISNQPFTAVPFALFAANSESTAALAALQATVAANATATTTALALKEDAANKSTTTTLGTSNVLFPTQNAVKTYVDSNITTVNANNTALQATVAANATATTSALALKENAANKSTTTTLGTSNILFPTQNAVKTYVDTNITTVNANNTALQATVSANATATTATLILKEDAANKSTTTTLGTSNVLFPTQNAVKTYVDSQVASATIPDANATTKGKIQLAGDLGGTAAAPTVPALANKENTINAGTTSQYYRGDKTWQTLDKTAVGLANVDNTTDATKPISAATQTALNTKEDTTNKSTTTTLGTSDVLFPTQNAVKTYVDTNVTSINASNTALQSTVTANATATIAALALKEDAINKSTTTTLGTSDLLFPTQNAVKTYVDNQVSNGIATNVSGIVAIANGGTGSSVQNFVDLTNNQNIAGGKYFANNISANEVSIGSPGTGSQNTMLGAASFGYASPGSNNTGLGFFTLASLNGGNDNTAVGTNAIRQGGAANGSRNTAVGSVALSNGGEPNDNSALGYATLAVTSGGSNTAVGSLALQNNTTASYNVGVGFETLRSTTTGGSNTAVGRGAMYFNTSGDVNTAVGEYALVSNTNGRYNTSVGVQAQEQNTTGQSNTAIGVAAIDRNTAGNYNAVLGAFAGRYIADNSTFNTAIDNSVLIGALSRPLGNNANNEIVIGYNATGNGSNTVQLGNTSVTNVKTSGTITAGDITYPNIHGTTGQVLSTNGSGALSWSTPSSGGATTVGAINSTSNANGASIAAGELKLAPADATNGGIVTTGNQTFAGSKSFISDIIVNGIRVGVGGTNSTAFENVNVGINSLTVNTSGHRNSAFGESSLSLNTIGNENTAYGSYSLQNNTLGSVNNALGKSALANNSEGNENTSIGGYSLYLNTSGNRNTAIGNYSLFSNNVGSNNVAIGNDAGTNNTGSRNTFLGTQSKTTSAGAAVSNATAIGYGAEVGTDNTIQLGNTSVTNVNTSGSITANAEISSEITANLTISNANAEQYKAKVLICNPTSPITITFGNDLPLGFNCMVLQKSADANKINLAGGSGVTIKNRSNYTATAGNYAMATIVNIGGGIIVTAGDMQ